MEPGPATVRPDRQLADLLEPMRTHNLQAMVVTIPEGRLLGVLRRDDAERRLAEPVAPDR
jgi:predicted transcriptional regulator